MFTTGQKVILDNSTKAEVVKVFKNGKVQIRFWVHGFAMIRPELWTDTVRANRLTNA